MRSILIKIITITLASSMIFIGACSKSGTPGNKTDNNSGNKPIQSQEAQKVAAVAALPNADPNTPPDKYVQLNSGNQLMFMYYGLLNMPVDYDKIASSYSQDFRSTNDEFKKKDILNALKPRIDSEIANAKNIRYFCVDFDAQLGHYDFNTKGFPVNNAIGPDGFAYFYDNANYKYSFTNGNSFKLLKVVDEAKARQIENMVNKYPAMKLTMYVFTQDADPSNLQIKCQIVKMKLADHHGNELTVM